MTPPCGGRRRDLVGVDAEVGPKGRRSARWSRSAAREAGGLPVQLAKQDERVDAAVFESSAIEKFHRSATDLAAAAGPRLYESRGNTAHGPSQRGHRYYPVGVTLTLVSGSKWASIASNAPGCRFGSSSPT